MRFIFYCLFILLISSCNDKNTTAKEVIERPETSRVKKHNQVPSIQPKFQTAIDAWNEYENLRVFLQQFTAISPNDALNNSRELNDITKSIIDSVTPQFLETDAFKSRANLLYNETLRLYDMSSIPAIKASEVNNQVAKILNAFSSVNFKINTILTQRELEKDITESDFKTDVFQDFNINSYNSTQLIKKGSTRNLKNQPKSKFFKNSDQKIMLEEEYLQEKKNNQRKLKKDKKNN